MVIKTKKRVRLVKIELSLQGVKFIQRPIGAFYGREETLGVMKIAISINE